jgi:hypothetical protein
VTEIPFLTDLGDAFEVAIAAQAQQDSQPSRRRQPRRIAIIVAATAAVALLVASPAIGLRGHIVRLFSDEPPAPERVVESLTALARGVPQGGSPALDAREVLDAPVGFDQRAIIWLSPRPDGGFCSLLELQRLDGGSEGAGAECVPLMQRRLSFETSLRGSVSSSGEILSGPVLVDGWVSLAETDSVEVTFEGGGAVALPFVWVAEPVNTGFFVYGVPRAHWREGRLPAAVVVRNAAGKEIAHESVTGIDLRASYPASTGSPMSGR